MVPLAPDTLHTPAPLETTVNTTGLPDPPPVADKLADPPTDPDTGAVNEIAWGGGGYRDCPLDLGGGLVLGVAADRQSSS